MEPVDTGNAEHYAWGGGWHLVEEDGLSLTSERVPATGSEERHYHRDARRFSCVLRGRAAVEVDGERAPTDRATGIEVRPGEPHQFRNESVDGVEFPVISAPTARGDRIRARSE